jgi:ABC-type uncharacterized transport system permease subunit
MDHREGTAMIEILIAILSGSVILATPILFSALGEIYDERAGVLNLGIEGIMSVTAFAGLWATYISGSIGTGVLAAVSAGALVALIHGFACVTAGINQLISGLLISILADGVANFGYRSVYGLVSATIEPLKPINIPVLTQIPVIGPVLFQQNIFAYGAFLFAIIFGFVLYRTTWGLKIRAVGENPVACDTAGIDVNRVRYLCVILSGVMAGLGGACLALGYLGMYERGIVAGRGWIAIIVVILSRWSPYRAVLASLIFGFGYSTASALIGAGVGVPYYLLMMLPYIIAIIVIPFMFKRARGPSALTVPYRRK